MGNNPSKLKGPEHPVEQVSWEDCQDFIRRLNDLPAERGNVYRLPTEAEWEHACRAGSETAYNFGNLGNSLGDYAWYRENSKGTHPVGAKRPNAWGLYDMHGSVGEWCADWQNTAYYANSPLDDPQGSEFGSYRVYRGGSWGSDAYLCRSAHRTWQEPDRREGDQGFRLAMKVSYPSR